MVRLGLTEILLFLIIFFIIDPRGFPKLFRKIGELVGKIKSMRNELNNALGIDSLKNMEGSIKKKQEERVSDENILQHESIENIKLLILETLKKDYNYSVTDSVLKMLFDSSPDVRGKASKILGMDPVFSFEKRTIRRNAAVPSIDKCNSPLEEMFSAERINKFSEILENIPEKYFKASVSYLAEYPGIDNFDINRIFSGTKRQFYNEFRKEQKRLIDIKYPRQLTVSPSYKCNLNCPYCFTSDICKIYPNDMSLQYFKNILDKTKSDVPINRISIFGGEPTCFPELQSFIDEIENRELYFYFATNGIAEPDKFLSILNRPSLQSVTFHIERDSFYSDQQREYLLHNLENASKKKLLLMLRYNLQDPENTDWSFLEKYRTILPEVNFSFAVVFPSISRSNEYVNLDRLKDFKNKIISLISHFADRPISGKYRLVFAKPYPLCFFTKEELHYVLKNTSVKNICEIDKNRNTNNLLVNPDGSYSPCMAMMSDDFRFPSFNNIDDLSGLYYTRVKDLQKIPLMEDCRHCSLHHRGLCQAACYAYLN